MRFVIKLSSVFRRHVCHKSFRLQSTNSPFYSNESGVKIIGRPFLLNDRLFIHHPIYTGLMVLVVNAYHNPCVLFEVKVEPVKNWLMKQNDFADTFEKQQTLSEYLEGPANAQSMDLNPDELEVDDFKKHADLFQSVVAVGHLLKTLPSIRRTYSWHLGSVDNKTKPSLFVPIDIHEPGNRIHDSLSKDSLKETTYIFKSPRNTLARAGNEEFLRSLQTLQDKLLAKNSVILEPHKEFNTQYLQKAAESEFSKRRDFRSECVFSIDPPTAKDLDDALHTKELPGNMYEVGIHIADVNFFVPKDSYLWREAMQRNTSFYLPDKVIPMLPSCLSDDLCSLHPGSPKLTMSVLLKMDSEGSVISTWIGESVINSVAKLDYTQANQMIDDAQHIPDVPFVSDVTKTKLKKSVDILHQLSLKLRNRRMADGALNFNTGRTTPDPIEDKNSLLSFTIKPYGFSSILVEEFMLLANRTVAKYLSDHMPDQAFVRYHPFPKRNPLLNYVDEKSEPSKQVSAGVLKSLHQKIVRDNTVLKSQEDTESMEMTVSLLVIKSLPPASYKFMKSSSDISCYFHFGLHAPLYTHFTSPIRRFADLIVHYQLKCLLKNSSSQLTKRFLGNATRICNQKRSDARRLKRELQSLYMWAAMTIMGTVFSKVIVTYLSKNFICVYSPTFEIFALLHFNKDKSILQRKFLSPNKVQLTVISCRFCSKKTVLELAPFSELDCVLMPGKNASSDFAAILSHTIVCRNCREQRILTQHTSKVSKDVETLDHETALNAPLRNPNSQVIEEMNSPENGDLEK